MPVLLPFAACAPPFEHEPRTSVPATPVLTSAPAPARARAADANTRGLTLLDPGRPPQRRLQYALEPGSTREFRLELFWTSFEGDTELGSVKLQAPLVVRTDRAPAGYSLSIQLGPIGVTREGQSDAIRWGGVDAGGSDARVVAVVDLAASGVVRGTRIEESSGGEAPLLLFASLVNLDAPPSEPVGAGARWRTRREEPGGVETLSEHELVQIAANVATFRVQRQQTDSQSATGVRSIGEWSFTSDAWPPTGHDLLSASLPESGPRARFSVRFAVSAGAVEGVP